MSGSRHARRSAHNAMLQILAFALALAPSCAASTQTLGIHLKRHSPEKQQEDSPSSGQAEVGTAHHFPIQDEQRGTIQSDAGGNGTKHSCSIMAELDRIVMAAGEHYDLQWLRELHLPYIQYQSSDSSRPHYFVDNANEGGAYMQYIYDYYDCLPEMIAFIHGHGGSGWHFNDMSDTLRAVDWEHGPNFIDINKNPNDTVHYLGDARSRPANPIAWGADVYTGGHDLHQIIGGVAYESFATHLWLMDQAYMRFYDKHLGPEGLGEMPGSVRITCCAQFVVRREAIRLRSRDFYKRTLNYLANNDLRGNNYRDSKYVVGDAVSVFWSMIFGAADISPMRDCSLYSREELPARCA